MKEFQKINAGRLFIDADWSGKIDANRSNDVQTWLNFVNEDSSSHQNSKTDVGDHVDTFLADFRICHNPKYEPFTSTFTKPWRLDIFTLQCLFCVIQQTQGGNVEGLAVASLAATFFFESLVCYICLCQKYPKLGKVLPSWILKNGNADIEMHCVDDSLPTSLNSVPSPSKCPATVSILDDTIWSFNVPFMAYFSSPFQTNILIFNHPVPKTMGVEFMFTRAFSNILTIVAGCVYREAVKSYNLRMMNDAVYDAYPTTNSQGIESSSQTNICRLRSTRFLFFGEFGVLVNFSNVYNIFIVWCMLMSVFWCAISEPTRKSLRRISSELVRYPIHFRFQQSQSNARKLWQDVDMLMVQELTTTSDFFDKVLGFHDLFSTITKQPVKSWKRRRLLALSVLPLLMAIIVSASLLLCRIRSLSTFFRIPCLDRSCMDLFPTDMVRNCSAASNSTFVWSEKMPDSDYGYNFGCLYCSILIDGTHDRHNLILLHSLGKTRNQFIFANLTADEQL